jgi:hypothetical protein
MAQSKSAANECEVSRGRFAEVLNEDLSHEYQTIIAYHPSAIPGAGLQLRAGCEN